MYKTFFFFFNMCNLNMTFLLQDYKQVYQKPEEKLIRQPSIDNKYSTKQKKDPIKTVPAAEPKTKMLVTRNIFTKIK